MAGVKAERRHLAITWYLALSFPMTLAACGDQSASNDKPRYGKSGLPSNCRALVQANIDGWRAKQYTSEEVMSSLERNCGAAGYLWEQ